MNRSVSIVIPCYNDELFINEAVQSALNQTCAHKEVIVVDDGSNKQTKEVLKKLESKIDKLITQKNKGQSNARNTGILASKNPYILVLDSDDYFEPSFCEKALDKMEANDHIKLISCFSWLLYDDQSRRLYEPSGGSIQNFLFSNCATGSSFFRKSEWKMAGGYDETMTQGFEDWEFYIRLLAQGGEAFIIKETLFNYRKRKDSTTTRANTQKYELWKYIFTKHKDLYIQYYNSFLDFFLSKIEREEQEKLKNIKRIEFLIGSKILQPIRYLKNKFN